MGLQEEIVLQLGGRWVKETISLAEIVVAPRDRDSVNVRRTALGRSADSVETESVAAF